MSAGAAAPRIGAQYHIRKLIPAGKELLFGGYCFTVN